MNKRGFTLIELLAVIVILAVIALIATPAVLNIIEDSKRSSAEDSARIIAKEAETYYMSEGTLQGNEVGDIDLTTDILKYKGEKPEKGYVTYDDKGNAYLKMYINGYCVESNYDNTVTSEKTESKDCEMNIVSVPLELNGGTLSITAINYESGSMLGELPTPTKTGYTFKGWYDGNGNPVTAETVVVKGLTLNAQWSQILVTVTYVSEGTTIKTSSVQYGSTYDFPTLTKEGYILEWQVNGVTITEETIVSTTNNHEVVANWEVEPTYLAGLYFNPITNSKCSSTEYNASTNSKNGFRGTEDNGCLLWYAYKEENGNYLMILDHNTSSTELYWSVANTELMDAADDTTNLYGWHADVRSTIRMISGKEVVEIAPKSGTWTTTGSSYYLHTGTSGVYYGAKGTNNYGWLFDNTDGCDTYGCNVEQSGHEGYWTSTAYGSDSHWDVNNEGELANTNGSSVVFGARPVISVPKSKFVN